MLYELYSLKQSSIMRTRFIKTYKPLRGVENSNKAGCWTQICKTEQLSPHLLGITNYDFTQRKMKNGRGCALREKKLPKQEDLGRL